MLEQGEMHPFDLQESWSPERIPNEATHDDSSGQDDDEYKAGYDKLTKEFADFPHESTY